MPRMMAAMGIHFSLDSGSSVLKRLREMMPKMIAVMAAGKVKMPQQQTMAVGREVTKATAPRTNEMIA